MSSGDLDLRSVRRRLAALALGMALACAPAAAAAPEVRSSPEDRRRFVSITRSLEQAPLNPALKADREWARLVASLDALPWRGASAGGGVASANDMLAVFRAMRDLVRARLIYAWYPRTFAPED